MNARRAAGSAAGIAALALAVASGCYGVGVLALVALGSVHPAAITTAAAALGFSPFAAVTGWFVLKATRGQVLPVDADPGLFAFRGG